MKSVLVLVTIMIALSFALEESQNFGGVEPALDDFFNLVPKGVMQSWSLNYFKFTTHVVKNTTVLLLLKN